MKLTIGMILRSTREEMLLSREQAAKRLKISAGYLGHLERDSHVPLSIGLISRFSREYGPGMRMLEKLVLEHNKKVKKTISKFPSNR